MERSVYDKLVEFCKVSGQRKILAKNVQVYLLNKTAGAIYFSTVSCVKHKGAGSAPS